MKQNHSASIFFHMLITFHFSVAGKKLAYLPLYAFEKTRVSCYKLCEKNKSIKLQKVEKIKLSRLLVQRINEFKMNETQRKTAQ